MSIVKTTVATATFFATTAPIWVVLVGWLFLKIKPTAAVLSGLALCLCGGALLLAQSLAIKPAEGVGDIYGLLTGVFFGLYFLAVSAARRVASAARVTFEATLVTAALLFVVAVTLEGRLWPHSLARLAALLAMAWISHAGGQGLLVGCARASAGGVLLAGDFLEAVAAAVFAALILSEPVAVLQAVGGGLILAGVFAARP